MVRQGVTARKVRQMNRDRLDVHVHQGDGSPGFWAMFWLLAIVIAIWHFIGWILLGLGVSMACFGVYVMYRKFQQSNAQIAADVAELQRRADRQHNWFFKGDPRGIYGDDMWKGLSVEDFRNTHGERGK